MNPRPSRILAAAVTLVTVGAMAVAVVAGAAVSGTPAPAAGLSASSPSAAATVVAGESRVAWPEGVGISTDATDEERLAAKLSFDMVAVPDDRADSVRSIPGLVIGGDASAGGTTYLAVPADDVPRVTAAVPDAAVTANARIDAATHQSPVPSWGEDAVDSPSASSDGAYDYDTTGAGTTVYVVDTGVQSDHPDFGGRVDAANGHDEVGDDLGTEDCVGHGTHVAGTVASSTYGIAKDARIVPVRVLGCQGGSLVDLLYGLIWIYDNTTADRSVVNISIETGAIKVLNDLVQVGVDRGYVMVVAAGNSSSDACRTSPASAAGAITVGAVDESRALAWYSNYGSCVDIVAPGSNILSTWIGSETKRLDGTSMATPHVSGLAARLVQVHPSWGTNEVLAALSTPEARGHISGLPTGTPDLFAALTPVPRVLTLSADPADGGLALAWTINDVGSFRSFSLDITDTTSKQEYSVVVSSLRRSTVFTEWVAGHSYTVTIGGTAQRPTGEEMTVDTVEVAVPSSR